MLLSILTTLSVSGESGSSACAGEPQPAMERLVLADGNAGPAWHAAEARMEADAKNARDGRAMHFHVEVDHHAGEPKYPIGWPRTYTNIPVEHRDWKRWDFVEFWVYADSSRDRLPSSPLGFIVRAPDRNNSFNTTLSAVRMRQWVHFRFPTASIPNRDDCTAIQLFISESNYAHGDVVEFWIDDLQLSRYAEPTILAVRPLNRVLYEDAQVLRIEVEMTGLETGDAVDVEVGLRRDENAIASASVPLCSGESTIPLPISNVSRGDGVVYARVAGTQRTLTETVRIVSSPWKEAQ